jgi:hypothetical protein
MIANRPILKMIQPIFMHLQKIFVMEFAPNQNNMRIEIDSITGAAIRHLSYVISVVYFCLKPLRMAWIYGLLKISI